MALRTGLLPAFVFALTVGIAVPTALGAHLLERGSTRSFGSALRVALLGVGVAYIGGVAIVYAATGGGALWGLPAALLVAGLAAFLLLAALPLLVGRELVRLTGGTDPETALRFATYGWPVAALAVFAEVVAPGGHGHLLDLEGARTCLVGFCGVAVPLVAAVILELVMAVFGPGLVGLALYASSERTSGRRAGS